MRRDFVQSNYKELKTANPTFPFLVRECEGVEAKVWARYGKKEPPLSWAGKAVRVAPAHPRDADADADTHGTAH